MCNVYMLIRHNYINLLSYLLIDRQNRDRIGDIKMGTLELMKVLAKAIDKNCDNDVSFFG